MPTAYCNDRDWGDNNNACFVLENLSDASNVSMFHDIIYYTTENGIVGSKL